MSGATEPTETEQAGVDYGEISAIGIIQDIAETHPNWRAIQQTTPEGNAALMVEFGDDEGEFTEGLPGRFLEAVSDRWMEEKWFAFVDGFMQSGEGGNAEHPHAFDREEIKEKLRPAFEEEYGRR